MDDAAREDPATKDSATADPATDDARDETPTSAGSSPESTSDAAPGDPVDSPALPDDETVALPTAKAPPRDRRDDLDLLEDVREPLVELVGALKLRTGRGTLARSFLNSLLQDLHIMVEAVKARAAGEAIEGDETDANPDAEPGAGRSSRPSSSDHRPAARAPREPNGDALTVFLDALIAKLVLGAELLPAGADRIQDVAERIGRLRSGRREWMNVRLLLRDFLEGPVAAGLRREARDWMRRGPGLSGLDSLRHWKDDSAGPPLSLSSLGQVIEGLALHLAHVEAERTGVGGPTDEAVRVSLEALGEWLESRGAVIQRPTIGDLISGRERVVFRRMSQGEMRRGAIDLVVTPGYLWHGVTIARPMVIASPGSGSHVLEVGGDILARLPGEIRGRVEAALEALKDRLWRRLDDSRSDFVDCVEATLDIVETLRGVARGREVEARLIRAMLRDFEGADLEIIAPATGALPGDEDELFCRRVYSSSLREGRIVEVERLGLKLFGVVTREACVLVSAGSAPEDRLGRLLVRIDHAGPEWREDHHRLQRARERRPGDRGRALAVELIDLLLRLDPAAAVTEDDPTEAIALGLVEELVDGDLPVLSEQDGFEPLRALLRRDRAGWAGPGLRLLRRLLRPFHDVLCGTCAEVLQLKARVVMAGLAAALDGEPRPHADAALSWAIRRLRDWPVLGQELPGADGGRLARTLAAALGDLHSRGEQATLEEVHATLSIAGIVARPGPGPRLQPERALPEYFDRVDAVYSEQPRLSPLAPVHPGLRLGGHRVGGLLRVSLGPRPKTLDWLESESASGTALGGAAHRLAADLVELDRRRLLDEMEGDAAGALRFAMALAGELVEALERCAWSARRSDRAAFLELFDLVHRDFELEILPGRRSRRELERLARAHEGAIRLVESRRPAHPQRLGALYRGVPLGRMILDLPG